MGIEELINEYKKQIENNMKYIKGEWACEADRISGMKIAVDVLRKVVKDLNQLKSPLPTQQDKVVVPEYIKKTMAEYDSLQEMLTEEYYSDSTDEIDNDKVQCWIDDNFDLLCRAWLDMPKIDVVKVPPMIDKYLNFGNKAQKLASLVSNKYTMLDHDVSNSEIKQWLREISMDDLLSLANGYTVEKEQLYYVRLPFNEGNHIKTYYLRKGKVSGDTWFGSSNAEYSGNTARLTEQEIKDHDERYWAFAAPVEEDE